MSDGAGDSDAWAFTEGKDWKDGRSRRENPYVHDHAGEVDRDTTREVLTAIRQAFERAMDRGWIDIEGEASIQHVEDLAKWQHLEEHARTEQFAAAVDEGDAEAIRAMVGSEQRRPDLSGYRTLEQLRDIVGAPAFIGYMWAPPGAGKTNFGCLLGEIWSHEHPEGEVATNIRSLEQADRWIQTYPSLVDWLTGDADDWTGEGEGTRKLFIFDEASSHASGRGAQGYETAKKLGPLLYKIRKYGGSLIIIGHDGRDVHPAVRALGKAIHKEDLKRATIYESVHNREGEDEIFSLEGIPQTSWSYDDKEATSWNWGEDENELEREAMDLAEDMADERVQDRVEDELLEVAVKAKRAGQSYSDLEEWHPWSRGKLGEKVSEAL